MTVYVDDHEDRGWKLRGHATPNCHLFTDAVDLGELHAIPVDRRQAVGIWRQRHATIAKAEALQA